LETTDLPATRASKLHRDLRLDASEWFVFISGHTCMLAYGGALRHQGWRMTAV
jgi:hypothetical protein